MKRTEYIYAGFIDPPQKITGDTYRYLISPLAQNAYTSNREFSGNRKKAAKRKQALIQLLSTKPYTVIELSNILQVNRDAIYYDLRKLAKDHLVTSKNGLWFLAMVS